MVVGLVESAKIPPGPLITLHRPAPSDGVLPLSITVVAEPVIYWSLPALAIVGV